MPFSVSKPIRVPALFLPGRAWFPHTSRLVQFSAPLARSLRRAAASLPPQAFESQMAEEMAPLSPDARPAASRLLGEIDVSQQWDMWHGRLVAIGVEPQHWTHSGIRSPSKESTSLSRASSLPGVPVCLCRIVTTAVTEQGAQRLWLHGLSRARARLDAVEMRHSTTVVESVVMDCCRDLYPEDPAIDRRHRSQELLSLLERLSHGCLGVHVIERFLEPLPLGILCDVIADGLGATGETGRQLLEEWDVDVRSELMLEWLKRRDRQSAGHLPNFDLLGWNAVN